MLRMMQRIGFKSINFVLFDLLFVFLSDPSFWLLIKNAHYVVGTYF